MRYIQKQFMRLLILSPVLLSALLLYSTHMPKGLRSQILQGFSIITGTVILFIITYLIYIKIIHLLDKEHESNSNDLLFSMISGITLANLMTLSFKDMFGLSTVSMVLTIIFVAVFATTCLYFYFSKSTKLTTIIFSLNVVLGFLILSPITIILL